MLSPPHVIDRKERRDKPPTARPSLRKQQPTVSSSITLARHIRHIEPAGKKNTSRRSALSRERGKKNKRGQKQNSNLERCPTKPTDDDNMQMPWMILHLTQPVCLPTSPILARF